MNKKFLYIAVGGFALFLVFVIYLVVSNSSNNNKNKETTLTFWNLDDDQKAFEPIIAAFQTAHPTVKIEYVKKDSTNYLNNILEVIAAGQGPDILAVPNDWLPKYHTLLTEMPQDKIADKKNKKSDTDVYKATFPTVVSSDNIIDGKIYGMPLAAETLELYLNGDILSNALADYRKTHEEVDPALQKAFNEGPKNWDEFAQIVQIVTQKNGANITRSGAAIGTSKNVNQSVDLLTLMMLQNGAKLTNDNNSSALFHTEQNTISEFAANSFPGTQALEFYSSFAKAQNKNYTWNASMPDAQRAFAEGKTAILIDYPSAGKEIKRINPNISYTEAAIPQTKESGHPINFASYVTYGVNRNSKNATIAWDFILSLTSQENSNAYTQATKKQSARLDRISEDSPILTAAGWFKPDPQKADDIFKEMIDQVVSGQTTQTAIDSAAAKITNLLGALKQ